MAPPELDSLLLRLAEGQVSESLLVRARALLATDARFPEALRLQGLTKNPAGSARALLELLGTTSTLSGPLTQALLAESGAQHGDLPAIDWPKLASQLGDAAQRAARDAVPVAQAVRHQAGAIHIADQVCASLPPLPASDAPLSQEASTQNPHNAAPDSWVSAMLDGALSPAAHLAAVHRLQANPVARHTMTAFASLGQQIRQGVADEAGEPPLVWQAIAPTLGLSVEVDTWDPSVLPQVVRAEAGTVNVVPAVLERVRASSLATHHQSQEASANRNLWQAAVLIAASLILLIWNPFASVTPNNPVVQAETTQRAARSNVAMHPPKPIEFAGGSEIVVSNLEYADQAFVQIIQNQDEITGEGALIIWLEEGANL